MTKSKKTVVFLLGESGIKIQEGEATMPTKEEGFELLREIRSRVSKKRRVKIYLIGSLARRGEGSDVDAIFEVEKEYFDLFVEKCTDGGTGFHPIKKAVLSFYSAFWDYNSPVEFRRMYALEAIGLSEVQVREFEKTDTFNQLDILCLPIGWNVEGSEVQHALKKIGLHNNDPRMLEKITRDAIPV